MSAEHVPEKIGHNDSVSRVVKQAVLKGIAIGQIRRETHGAHASRDECNEEILNEVLKLSKLVLSKMDFERFRKLLTGSNNSVEFFSNDRFREIDDFCDKIQEGLDSGVNIEISQSHKIPELQLPKFLDEKSKRTGRNWLEKAAEEVADALIIAALTIADAITLIMREEPAKEIHCYRGYYDAMRAVCAKLLDQVMKDEKMSSRQKHELVSTIKEQLEKNEIFFYEKTLVNISSEGFVFRFMDTMTEDSKQMLQLFIKSVKTINNIRILFSKQCYIGIVGLQNSGKTTLLNKLWNAGGKSGQRQHTDKAEIFELDPKVFVMDFPGTNGVESHANTFANCGPMNNFFIIVVRFDGNLNMDLCNQLQQVFRAMAGSNTTHFLLCVNRCNPDLLEMLEEDDELQKKANAIDFLRQEYATKINQFNGTSTIQVTKENIMFTDWKRPGEGICGAEDVRMKIGEYIKDIGIFNQADGLNEESLRRCLNKNCA